MKKRLDVQVQSDRYEYIKEVSDRTGIPMNAIADELLALGISVKRGELIEQQSLPVIRDIVQSELQKQLTDLRMHIGEDVTIALTNEVKAVQRASDNRLAALLVRIGRDAHIALRLTFSQLALAYGRPRAMEVYEDAKERAGAAVSRRGNDEA